MQYATSELEAAIAAGLASGEVMPALKLAVEGFGPEVIAFIRDLTGSAEHTQEAYAQACEDLVRNASAFRGECSFRTWFYAVARHAVLRLRDADRRHAHGRLSSAPELEAAIRSSTAAHLQTEWKNRFRHLREQLSEDDRMLLVLRVDRGLSWKEVSSVFDAPGVSEAMLRKRFERLKSELRKHAEEAGWWAEL
jgi:RNA polymerase sigma-70 factor (ECF subfamily)